MTPVLSRTTWKVASVLVPKRGTALHVTTSRSDSELAKTPFPAAAAAGFQSCHRTAILAGDRAIRTKTSATSVPRELTVPPALKWASLEAETNVRFPLELMKTLVRLTPKNGNVKARLCWNESSLPRLRFVPVFESKSRVPELTV